MSAKRGSERRGRQGRSAEQRRASAAVPAVMAAWEDLTDQERLPWESSSSLRRMSAVSYFKMVNMRRLLRGEEMIRVPPLSKPYDPRPLLKGLDIRNRDGRITLELELTRAPDTPRTVWASRPCNRGVKKPDKCPWLGWLPVSRGRWREITALYFKKHGEYIKDQGLELVGKRIFVRLRQETDDGANLYEQVRAVVPKPEVKMGKKALIPTKLLRSPCEAPAKHHADHKPSASPRHALGWRDQGPEVRSPKSEG